MLLHGEQFSEQQREVDGGRLALDVVDRRPLAGLRTVHEEAGAGRLAGKTVIVIS